MSGREMYFIIGLLMTIGFRVTEEETYPWWLWLFSIVFWPLCLVIYLHEEIEKLTAIKNLAGGKKRK